MPEPNRDLEVGMRLFWQHACAKKIPVTVQVATQLAEAVQIIAHETGIPTDIVRHAVICEVLRAAGIPLCMAHEPIKKRRCAASPPLSPSDPTEIAHCLKLREAQPRMKMS